MNKDYFAILLSYPRSPIIIELPDETGHRTMPLFFDLSMMTTSERDAMVVYYGK